MLTNAQLKELAAAQKTPCYVFDTDALRSRMMGIRTAVGADIRLCYAMKANPFLVPAMLQCTDALEVCSPGELTLCENLGVPMEKVVFSGVQKTQEDIAAAVQKNTGVYTAESILHVERLQAQGDAVGKTLPVLLRLSSGSQFGMEESVLRHVIENRSQYAALDFVGLHYFVGTQRKKTSEQQAELARLATLCEALQAQYGFTVQRLEYGPGLWVPYFTTDDFSEPLSQLRALVPQLQALAKTMEVTLEMGRFFTASCGYYLTTVMDVKQNSGVHYALVDGGIHHFNYYGQTMGMKVPILRHFVGESLCPHCTNEPCEEDAIPITLCGSLCTTADILVRGVKMHRPAIGDLLVLCHVGAYSVTESPALFLSRKMPSIVLYGAQNGPTPVRDALSTDTFNTIGACHTWNK